MENTKIKKVIENIINSARSGPKNILKNKKLIIFFIIVLAIAGNYFLQKAIEENRMVTTYSTKTNPSIASNKINNFWLDKNSNYLYINTSKGLSIIDTKGTKEVDDDDLVITYSKKSSPAIADNPVRHSWIDKNMEFLYINTSKGLSIIDTKGTKEVDDDDLVITYSKKSSPAIADNLTYHSWMNENTGCLHISTEKGLSVIDTKKTKEVNDDELVITYSTNSNPAIADDKVMYFWFNEKTSCIYASTSKGLSVIFTNRTKETDDDELVITYSTSSNPAIANNNVGCFWLDPKIDYLYVSNTKEGKDGKNAMLSIIDTRSTRTASDDVFIENRSFNNSVVNNFWVDKETDYKYVSTSDSLYVIDSKKTKDIKDDRLIFEYSRKSNPPIGKDHITHSWLDKDNGLFYISTLDGGLSVIDTMGTKDMNDDELLRKP